MATVEEGGFLCLDTGTTTGWTYGTGLALPRWGCIKLAGVSDPASSFVGLDDLVTLLIGRFRPSVVAYEAPLAYTDGKNGKGNRDPRIPRLLLGLAAHVQSCCFRANMPCVPRHVGTVRAAVLGKGSFPTPLHGDGKVRGGKHGEPVLKGDAKEEVAIWCQRMGWGEITDPNARDAAVLLRYEAIQAGTAKRMAA